MIDYTLIPDPEGTGDDWCEYETLADRCEGDYFLARLGDIDYGHVCEKHKPKAEAEGK